MKLKELLNTRISENHKKIANLIAQFASNFGDARTKEYKTKEKLRVDFEANYRASLEAKDYIAYENYLSLSKKYPTLIANLIELDENALLAGRYNNIDGLGKITNAYALLADDTLLPTTKYLSSIAKWSYRELREIYIKLGD